VERSPKTLIVDASAATKWFVEEVDSEKANLLKRAHETGRLQLAAPDLLVYEVSNALVYHPKMNLEDLTQGITRLLELDLDLIPPRADFAAETARIARKYAVSVYDASYIALADIVGTNCVTADEKLYRKLHGKKPFFLLGALGRDWNLPRES
jgi:predicted nucleic acid-binding protein